MTHLIPIVSTKSDRAIRFGSELDRAMRTRSVGKRPLAAAIGSSETSVMYWRTGRILPRLATAEKLAEALAWTRLASLARELRAKSCLTCGIRFVDDSGSDNRRYCGLSCRGVKRKSVVGVDRRQRAAIAERRLLVHQRAVGEYCLGCEPDGRCRTADCALRPVSPLPLYGAPPDIVALGPSSAHGRRTPGAQSASMRSMWARYTPDERAERLARMQSASRVARVLGA